MKNRNAHAAAEIVGESSIPAAVIAAGQLVDQLTDRQRRDALLHLCGAAPHRVIAAFAAVTAA